MSNVRADRLKTGMALCGFSGNGRLCAMSRSQFDDQMLFLFVEYPDGNVFYKKVPADALVEISDTDFETQVLLAQSNAGQTDHNHTS